MRLIIRLFQTVYFNLWGSNYYFMVNSLVRCSIYIYICAFNYTTHKSHHLRFADNGILLDGFSQSFHACLMLKTNNNNKIWHNVKARCYICMTNIQISTFHDWKCNVSAIKMERWGYIFISEVWTNIGHCRSFTTICKGERAAILYIMQISQFSNIKKEGDPSKKF